MKKLLIIILFFMCITTIQAKEIEVKFSKCVDGDTAKFIYKDEEITARFLAIDTPETVHPTQGEEENGKEASEFTCNKIKNANEILLEYDSDSDKLDKYGRHLVWVFVDDALLQKEIVREGLASVAYLYGDYKYTDELEKVEQLAEEEKLGIWNTSKTSTETIETNSNKVTNEDKLNTYIEEYKEYVILIGALVIVSIFNLKSKKQIKRKLKNKLKKDIKKKLK